MFRTGFLVSNGDAFAPAYGTHWVTIRVAKYPTRRGVAPAAEFLLAATQWSGQGLRTFLKRRWILVKSRVHTVMTPRIVTQWQKVQTVSRANLHSFALK